VRSTLRPRLLFGLVIAMLALLPWAADAQHRLRGRVAVGFGYAPFYYPFYWAPYYWGWHPSPWLYPQYPYYPAAYDAASNVRLLVTPREAEVYVDGYLVGVVDDFDGFSQRLRLRPGEHEIQLYLPGYRVISQKMLFRPRETYKLRYTLEKLGDGETQEPRPTPSPAARTADPAPYAWEPPERSGTERGAFGTLALRVQPRGAAVLIDGEPWDAPDDERLVVELPEGTHRVEVRLDGYRTYSTDVDVQRGRVTTLNVSLLSLDSEV